MNPGFQNSHTVFLFISLSPHHSLCAYVHKNSYEDDKRFSDIYNVASSDHFTSHVQ